LTWQPVACLLLALAVLSAGCDDHNDDDDVVGPVGGVVVESEQLTTVSDSLCAVTGTLFNTNNFAVDVTLRWRAFDSAGVQIGDTQALVSNAAPFTRASFQSASFGSSVPCARIARFERSETRVSRT